jgi:hypothetical protein
LPSGPGEFHPRPLTDPDVTVSGHPARATHCRLPPAADPVGLLPLPVGPERPAEWPAPLAPRALPRLLATTAQSAPCRCIGTFGLAGPPLGPFPLAAPARFSRSGQEPRLGSRHLYTGHHMASQQAPAMLFPDQRCESGFDVVHVLSMRQRWFACARLPNPHLTCSSRLFPDAHHHGFWPQQLRVVWSLCLYSGSEGPPFISCPADTPWCFVTQHLSYSMTLSRLLDTGVPHYFLSVNFSPACTRKSFELIFIFILSVMPATLFASVYLWDSSFRISRSAWPQS